MQSGGLMEEQRQMEASVGFPVPAGWQADLEELGEGRSTGNPAEDEASGWVLLDEERHVLHEIAKVPGGADQKAVAVLLAGDVRVTYAELWHKLDCVWAAFRVEQ